MSSIRSSKGLAVAVAIAVALVTVGTAAAVTISGETPEPTTPGERVTMTASVEDPFQDRPSQWTMRATTELENATWTIQVEAQGDLIKSNGTSGETIETQLNRSSGATDISIDVTGTVPEIGSFNYDDPSVENVSLLTISQDTAALDTFSVHRYTEASRDARQAIDDAIDSVGSRNDNIDDAISSYNGENFQVAENLADDAQSSAESSQLLLIVIGVVVVLALVGGGVYYWRQQRQPGNKLQ